MPLEPQDPQENKNSVDIGKILLPKKEAPGTTTDSAQRVSAGVLLDQEIKAGAEGLPKKPVEPKPAPAPKPAVEESEVKPLVTYQAAIEKVMKGGDVSVVSIATAEANRRSRKTDAEPEAPKVDIQAYIKKYAMIAGGVLFIAAAASAAAYIFLRPTTVPVVANPESPFISVDETVLVLIAPNESSRDIVSKLDAEKKKVELSLGLVARLIPSTSSTTESGDILVALSAQQFLSSVAPNIPANLLRTIEPEYVLGVHAYNANQPFLVMRVDAYQEAFKGLLAWEFNMRNDLAPLFNYTPRERIPEENVPLLVPVSTSTATSTATTTSSGSSTPPTTFVTSIPTRPSFVDKIVENHDARVLQNEYGDIYFMWTFLDRNTLVITTNPATLREIISRLKSAPITSTPGQ